jgi:organic hydroperoxide reductase OsmC/OhrA
MLTFLAVAAKKKFVLDEYVDEAVGHMDKNADGKLAITRVTLKPRLKFSGDKQPTSQEIEEMNHMAHDQCFIANSVKTEVAVETQS